MHQALLALAALLFIGCSAAPEQAVGPAALVNVDGTDYVIDTGDSEAGEVHSVADLVDELATLRGWRLEATPNALALMRSSNLRLQSIKRVPADALLSFMQIILIMNGLTCDQDSGDELVRIEVVHRRR
ncbi:MAG: hypothetical protein ACI8QC_003907 [Planctomycetota bacterium]|jgi:hypothetical protein